MPFSSTVVGPVELGGELLDELPAHRMGDGDAAGRRRLLQADDEADRRAEAVVALDEDIGERHAEPDPDRLVALVGVPLGHRLLEGDRPFDRVLDAREFDQRAVAHRLEEIAAMGGERRPEHLQADGSEREQRAALVRFDEACVARRRRARRAP